MFRQFQKLFEPLGRNVGASFVLPPGLPQWRLTNKRMKIKSERKRKKSIKQEERKNLTCSVFPVDRSRTSLVMRPPTSTSFVDVSRPSLVAAAVYFLL